MHLAPQEIRTFFVTTVTAQRRRIFQTERNAELMMGILASDRAKGRYALHAFVIMPDHLHLILTPAPEVALEKAMQYIKGGFSYRLKAKFGVWEKSFMERRLKDRSDYWTHEKYLHENPVRAGLAAEVGLYPYSSAARRSLVDAAPVHFA